MIKRLICSTIIVCTLFCIFNINLYVYTPGNTKGEMAVFSSEYTEKDIYPYPVRYMYSSDGERHIVPVEAIDIKSDHGWYTYPVTTVYNSKGEKKLMSLYEANCRPSAEWFNEKVAAMTKGNTKKTVGYSKVKEYRSEGWFTKKYFGDMNKLGEDISTYIKNKKGKIGIYVKNLNTGDELIINDDKYNAASIIKLYVMAGIYNEIYSGNISMNSAITKHLKYMITLSDNYSSNYLVKQAGKGNYKKGFDNINELCMEIDCINTSCLSLFSGHGEYMAYGSNYVTPYDCGILLEKIYLRELVSPEYSDKMLELLKNQTRTGKIPYKLPKGTVCANKTGETSNIESDVAIVYSPACDYIICVLTNNCPTAINDIRKISEMTYDYFNP